ncbi:MAG TPA: aspartate aminotransferase family protein [Verrucomicrobiota bacterium]|nr:aspartate aminotransferase family protein [Verrucomicrobiales bacterium]HRI14661.1 aspartate aminotransferase family protein [Verrucomicrobiota bacterium]
MTPPNPSALDSLRSEGDVNLSSRRADWAADHIGPKTQALLDSDANHFLHQSLSTPCLNVLARAEGAWIEDVEGRRYLDFHGNNVHQVGFGHPRVVAAIKHQLDELSFCTRRYTCEPAVQLACRLGELAPGDLKRVLFAPGGTSAIGMALKLARIATGRFKFVSMWDSFHGASLDAISVGGEAVFRKGIGPLLPGCEHVPPPEPMRCPFKCGTTCSLACADYVEYVLEKEGDVAAVIGETIRCTPFVPPPDYWKRIRAACDRHGALLILDEIPIGLGRTGKMFACEHYDVVPDLLVLGKGLGGGIFPLAALLARERLNVATHTALGHYTHEKNPVACAAGIATLDVIRDENLVVHAAELGEYALNCLNDLMKRRYPLIGDVRGKGLLLGIELVHPSANGTPTRPATDAAEHVMYAALKRGLNFKVTMGNILTLTPALVLTRSEMDQALKILDSCLAEVE